MAQSSRAIDIPIDLPIAMNAPHRVLLVEDDPIIARTLAMSLRYEGFELTVAPTAAEANRALAKRRFDMAMFDVGLPDGNGIDLCRASRRRDAAIPILMLSARTDEPTAVAGIEGDADDYIRKPYGLQELTARMRRLLARQRTERDTACFGGISIDTQKRTVAVGDVPVQLGRKEFDILLLLVHAQGDAVTREQILDRFEDGSAIYDRTIDSHLSHLRKKLKDDGDGISPEAMAAFGQRRNRRFSGSAGSNATSLGLGSVIIRTIVELHHGQLALDSRMVDGGTASARNAPDDFLSPRSLTERDAIVPEPAGVRCAPPPRPCRHRRACLSA